MPLELFMKESLETGTKIAIVANVQLFNKTKLRVVGSVPIPPVEDLIRKRNFFDILSCHILQDTPGTIPWTIHYEKTEEILVGNPRGVHPCKKFKIQDSIDR